MQAGREPPLRTGAHLRETRCVSSLALGALTFARGLHARGKAGAAARSGRRRAPRVRRSARHRRARRRGRPVDDADEELLRHPLQPARRDHAGQREESAAGVDLLHERAARPRGAADRREQHDVRVHAVPEHPLRARPHEARRAEEVAVRAEAAVARRRASRAATSSIADRRSPTARSSSTRSTITSSPWTRTRGRKCGRRRSATSTSARR